jgi:hypothetical protein
MWGLLPWNLFMVHNNLFDIFSTESFSQKYGKRFGIYDFVVVLTSGDWGPQSSIIFLCVMSIFDWPITKINK